MVVELVQLTFRDGVIAEEAAWQAVVLIPKGGGKYYGIGLVEVIWKAVAVVLNRRFTASITYHDSPSSTLSSVSLSLSYVSYVSPYDSATASSARFSYSHSRR